MQNHVDACFALTAWYLVGSPGVLPQSDTEAYLWAKKAAEGGLAKAMYAVGYFTEVSQRASDPWRLVLTPADGYWRRAQLARCARMVQKGRRGRRQAGCQAPRERKQRPLERARQAIRDGGAEGGTPQQGQQWWVRRGRQQR